MAFSKERAVHVVIYGLVLAYTLFLYWFLMDTKKCEQYLTPQQKTFRKYATIFTFVQLVATSILLITVVTGGLGYDLFGDRVRQFGRYLSPYTAPGEAGVPVERWVLLGFYAFLLIYTFLMMKYLSSTETCDKYLSKRDIQFRKLAVWIVRFQLVGVIAGGTVAVLGVFGVDVFNDKLRDISKYLSPYNLTAQQ